MSFSKYFRKIVLFITTTIIVSGCFDKPNEFVSPTWDAEVNISITTKEFNLLEIVEKDSSLLKASQDPETLGLIYFGDTQAVSTITIEDELRIDPFETSFSQSMGVINVSVPIPAASEIKVEDWTTEVTTGSLQIFPEQEGNVTIDVNGVETVESILAEEGKLSIVIWNNLPVEIELRGVRIQNASDGSIIADRSANNPNNWLPIPPFGLDTLIFPIDNKIITNTLQYIGTIYSVGSNGIEVQILDQAGTTILALFENLVIGAATAALPIQNFQFNSSLILDDSTKIEEAVIGEGRAVLRANNNMDVDLTANIRFDNLFEENGNKFALNIPLARNEKNKIIEISSLQNWTVVTATPGTPSNEISYSISVVTDSTGELSTITKNDSVSFSLNFDELVFDSFEGLLKPTIIDLEESGFKLDYGDFDDQLQFGEINFKDAAFYLQFNSSADLNLLVGGDLFATNGFVYNSQPIENIIIPSEESVKIDISELINGFPSELPDSFSIVGSALMNPYYQTSKVTRGDSVNGSIEFEIPLNVGIAQGSFRDTFDVDLGDVDRDDINRLNYGEVTFTIRNSVPVSLTFSARILDSNYTPVLDIPTPNDNISIIEVPKPDVSETGEIMLAGEIEQSISLYGEDIQKFLDNPYMTIQVDFNTAGENNTPVKFKTSNEISFDVRIKAEYRVDL
jgi:hypothetical protein